MVGAGSSRPSVSWFVVCGRSLAVASAVIAMSAHSALAICSTTICTAYSPPITNACEITGTHVIDNGCTLNFGTKVVTVQRPASLDTATPGHSYTITAGAVSVKGTLRAHAGTLAIVTTGPVDTQTINNSPGKLDVQDGGTLVIWAAGTVTLSGNEIDADGAPGGGAGGKVTVVSVNVTTTTPIHANGNGGQGGIITIITSGNINIGGQLSAEASSSTSAKKGGVIKLQAGGTLTTSKNLLVNGTNNGDGGTIKLVATGAASLGGDYKANGVGGGSFADAGTISAEAASVSITGNWFANGNQSAQGGDLRVVSRTGSVTIGAGVSLNADGGGNGGGSGGTIEVVSALDATVNGGMSATAGGADSSGGRITIRAPGTLTVTSVLEARSSATGGFRNGVITLGPACDIDVSGTLKTNNPAGGGSNVIHYYGTLDVSGATLLADAAESEDGGNAFLCGCVDVAEDGVCDSQSCASNPTTTGATITPSYGLTATLPSPCS